MRSPKSPYRIEIGYVKPLEGLGSASSYTGESIDQVLAYASKEVAANKTAAYIKVMRNEATYPNFNWVEVGTSKMDANGKLEQPLSDNTQMYIYNYGGGYYTGAKLLRVLGPETEVKNHMGEWVRLGGVTEDEALHLLRGGNMLESVIRLRIKEDEDLFKMLGCESNDGKEYTIKAISVLS